MKKNYDIVYLTNTPSFYKLNLCEALSRRGIRLLIVFNGYGSEAVNSRLDQDSDWSFDWRFLFEGDYWQRPKLTIYKRLLQLMSSIEARKVIFSGWMSAEYNLYSFFSHRKKNVMICESSKFEVDVTGFKGWIKRRLINRMSAALPSGTPHKELLEYMGFKGPQFITGSVGIINTDHTEDKLPVKQRIHRVIINGPKFLYVGRLTAVKNLEILIECFNRNGLPLTIAGSGELENDLKSRANPNITFLGFIENKNLGEIYKQHDVFILPSYSETWGLVVEEAMSRGVPVIVSDVVGSGPDMAVATGAGLTFKHNSVSSLQNAIEQMQSNYNKFVEATAAIDFDARRESQINAYIKALNN